MSITINDLCEKAYKYFVSKGMTKEGACGLLGNIYAESGIIANRVEILCLQRLREVGKGNYTDTSYTEAVNSGRISKTEFMNPLQRKQYGFGMCQWTSPSRKERLYERTVEKGLSIADEDAQLEYIMWELKTLFPGVLAVLQTTNSVKEASDKVLKDFESPSNWQSHSATRADYGQQIYNAICNTQSIPVQKVIDDAVDFAVKMSNDNSHGYSQATRSLYNITNPKSFDCSSLVLTSYYYAFVKNGLTKQADYLKANCSYTGNMMKMLNVGFTVVATNQTAHNSMQKGDVELNETHHTALAIDTNRIVHARSSEGASDTVDGSGNEIRVQDWYMYSKGWTHRLRFTGQGITSVGTPQNVSVNKNTSSSNLLRKGSKGDAVKTLQKNLNRIMNAGLEVDGDFGNLTYNAVISFQKRYNLEVDGIVGSETQSKLTSLINAQNGIPVPFMVKVIDEHLNIRTGPSTKYTICGAITDYGCYTITETKDGWGKLKSGMGWICLEYTKRI